MHLMQNFFAKIVQSAFLCSRLSKELSKVEIQCPEVGLNMNLLSKIKIRHSGSMPEDSGSLYKSPASSLKLGTFDS